MQTLEDKVIVYDDACPMCKAYTAGFVKAGWLKKRTGFSNASPEILAQIDLDRARHEIPLLDIKTGEVTYGLSALFLIVGEQMPVLKPLFNSRIFRAMLYPLYQIITYNRRIIAGSGAPKEGFDSAPDVNLFYRWLYISIAIFGGSWLSALFYADTEWAGKVFISLHLLILGTIYWSNKKLDFVGHWSTVFFATSVIACVLPGGDWVRAIIPIGLSSVMWVHRASKVFKTS